MGIKVTSSGCTSAPSVTPTGDTNDCSEPSFDSYQASPLAPNVENLKDNTPISQSLNSPLLTKETDEIPDSDVKDSSPNKNSYFAVATSSASTDGVNGIKRPSS